jgi:GntR family transcriptional regulator
METVSHKLPIYIKIKNDLINDILNGKYAVGSKLPSERFLAEEYNVSRVTARKSLDELISRNFAEIHTGKGTFVKRNSIIKDISECTGFTAHLEEQGLSNLYSKILKIGTTPAHHETALQLKIKLGEPVYVIDRARYLKDEVIAVEYSQLPRSLFPDLLKHDFEKESLYRTLQNEYGLIITNTTEKLSFHYCDEKLADIFNIDQGEPLFKLENISSLSDSIPFETCTSFYRNDFIFQSSRKISFQPELLL